MVQHSVQGGVDQRAPLARRRHTCLHPLSAGQRARLPGGMSQALRRQRNSVSQWAARQCARGYVSSPWSRQTQLPHKWQAQPGPLERRRGDPHTGQSWCSICLRTETARSENTPTRLDAGLLAGARALETCGWFTHDASFTPQPAEPVGHHRDGRPIYPFLGASSDDDADKPGDEEDAPSGGVPQEHLSRPPAREETQGGRAAVKKLLGDLGFDNLDAL